MRLRQLLMIGLVAAIPILVAVVLLSSGGSAGHGRGASGTSQATPTSGAGSGVAVDLHLGGAESKVAVSACGVSHHYSVYRAGATIAVEARTVAHGRWSARLKYKICRSGRFVAAGEATLGHLSAPGLRVMLRAPAPGLYAARVDLHSGGVLVGRSRKRYFEVR